MWLLEVPPERKNRSQPPPKLINFSGQDEIPGYAILSHTWAADEVLFADVMKGTAHERRGFEKVDSTIKQARRDGYDYVWIDSCCIDKSSSAELQEAINSMFAWYRDSQVCYVYLMDVLASPFSDSPMQDFPELPIKHEEHVFAAAFHNARWFSRGWTLQELIAPKTKVFFDSNWKVIGQIRKPDRFPDEETMATDLTVSVSKATGIEGTILQGTTSVLSASIATRMSWMANRYCSRKEDVAYSLLGIFDVNMPLIYGEGNKAFRRLQEEIIRQSDDTSIFRWQHTEYMRHNATRGLLADHPRWFSSSQQVTSAAAKDLLHAMPYSMTNKGLSIELPLRHVTGGMFLAILDCQSTDQEDYDTIYLWKLLDDANHFVRVFPHRLWSISQQNNATSQTIFIRQGIDDGSLWGKHLSDNGNVREGWLSYLDPVTHMSVEAAVLTKDTFLIEHGWQGLPSTRESNNASKQSNDIEITPGWKALENRSFACAFGVHDASAHDSLSNELQGHAYLATGQEFSTAPGSNASNDRHIPNVDKLHTTENSTTPSLQGKHNDDINSAESHNFQDALLLGEMIRLSQRTPHQETLCEGGEQQSIRHFQQQQERRDHARSALCCLFKHIHTNERLAVIIAREGHSIHVRAIPVGRIQNSRTYNVHVEATQIRFVDDSRQSSGDNVTPSQDPDGRSGDLQVHVKLKLAVLKQRTEERKSHDKQNPHVDQLNHAVPNSDACLACADHKAMMKNFNEQHRLGKSGWISLLGSCHQSEREVWLAITDPRDRKTVGFKDEVVQIPQ